MNEIIFIECVRKDNGQPVAINANLIISFIDYEIRTIDGQTIPVSMNYKEIAERLMRASDETR